MVQAGGTPALPGIRPRFAGVKWSVKSITLAENHLARTRKPNTSARMRESIGRVLRGKLAVVQ